MTARPTRLEDARTVRSEDAARGDFVTPESCEDAARVMVVFLVLRGRGSVDFVTPGFAKNWI